MERDMIRQMGNMVQMFGQGQTQGARGNVTTGTVAQQSANANFLLQGQIELANSDGTYELFVQGGRVTASACTDEPLLQGTICWVSKDVSDNWVIHGSVK